MSHWSFLLHILVSNALYKQFSHAMSLFFSVFMVVTFAAAFTQAEFLGYQSIFITIELTLLILTSNVTPTYFHCTNATQINVVERCCYLKWIVITYKIRNIQKNRISIQKPHFKSHKTKAKIQSSCFPNILMYTKYNNYLLQNVIS